MDLTTATGGQDPTRPSSAARASGVTAPSARLAGPDVVRAVALIGVVVMNYHGYLLLADERRPGAIGDGWLDSVFDPWDGPLSTRFAATFVLVAGVGVTLLTRGALGDPARVSAARWRLVRRGVLLYVVGLLLEEIWPGTIIPYYGVMFVVAAAMFTWRTRWVLAVGAVAAVSAAALRWWRFDRELDGHPTDWLTDPDRASIRRYVFDLALNGTHPLLPWLAFLCAGIALARAFHTRWWRQAAAGTGIALVAIAAVISSTLSGTSTQDHIDIVVSIDPYDRGLAYVASALGTALIAYAVIDWVATRLPHAVDPLRRAGQMTLTLYLLHVVVFNLLVDWWGWIEPAGLDVALTFAVVFWVVAIAAAVAWQRRFGRGPAEFAYRSFGG